MYLDKDFSWLLGCLLVLPGQNEEQRERVGLKYV